MIPYVCRFRNFSIPKPVPPNFGAKPTTKGEEANSMLLELSYPLSENIPKWPTNPNEHYTAEQSTSRGDPCNANSVFHHIHNGTHVDSPRHFDPNGRTIDEIPVEDFYYTSPGIIRAPKKKGEYITLSDLKSVQFPLEECDLLFLYTGYCELRESQPDAFVDHFPFIAPEAAQYLRSNFPKLKAIAIDSISVDSQDASTNGFPTHHALLEKNPMQPERTLLLFEDVNIRPILSVEKIEAVCAFPIRWKGLEGAPVSMVAFTK